MGVNTHWRRWLSQAPLRSLWRDCNGSSIQYISSVGHGKNRPTMPLDKIVSACWLFIHRLSPLKWQRRWWKRDCNGSSIQNISSVGHGKNRPTMPLDKIVSACWLFIHRLSPLKWQRRWWKRPIVQVKSHTIFGAIRRKQIISVLRTTHKMSISCHMIDCCFSANILKGTSNLTSRI